SARVFEITPGEPVNPCSDRADYTESQGSIDSEDVDVGPFSAWGYEALEYHGTLSKLGVLDGLGEFELEDGTTASVIHLPYFTRKKPNYPYSNPQLTTHPQRSETRKPQPSSTDIFLLARPSIFPTSGQTYVLKRQTPEADHEL
ncbi:MAG: hypothetical protein Q9205_005536, partial [Flavoplaca limonia]